MSKIKAKDLHFDNSQPAFLRRLRGEISGATDDPDRQINPLARPKGPSRLKNDDEDDGPTYVMEESNEMLSKAEYEALVNGEKDAENAKASGIDTLTVKDASAIGVAPAKQRVAEVGGPAKKRKATKIVGDEENDDQVALKDVKTTKSSNSDAKRPAKKKKAKAIKLSFGDDDEDQ